METKAWQLGSPGTIVYQFFDALRQRLNSRLVEYFLTRAITRTEAAVLEAGSGPAFASSILRTDHRVGLSIAVDIDPEALMQARSRDPLLSLVVADLNCLPFRSESVDLCWNSSTIEHLPEPAQALAEMQRVTMRGGCVFVGVPYVYGPLGFQRWIRRSSIGIWIGETFDRSQLIQLVTEADLKPKEAIFYFFRFFVGILAGK
ncbi:MAG TPA: class I SAM-dependent methyltransferase [Desulfomonilaceae bacterium]|nr:class I SAM-dependent methyltransferase [Desulfomonilaceae bacterium]